MYLAILFIFHEEQYITNSMEISYIFLLKIKKKHRSGPWYVVLIYLNNMDVCTLAISWMKNKLLSPIKVIRPQDILLHLEAIM